MKQLARLTATGLATVTAVLILWEFREALVLFILSLVVAAVLRPIVDRLGALGLPRSLALVFTYLAIIGLIILLAFTLGGPLLTEIQTMMRDLPASLDLFRTQWLSGSLLQQSIARNLQDLNNLFLNVTGDQWNIFVQNFLGITLKSLDLISNIMIIVAVSIYWSADHEHFMRLWLSILPAEIRTRWREIWQDIEGKIGAYLRSEFIQSLLTAIFLGIGYQLIGLKYPVTLAFIGAVAWLIIWIGGLVAVIPALLVGLAISPATGMAAVLYTIATLAFMEFIVQPRLFNRQRTSSLLVVVMVLMMVKEYGLVGFFIAPPLGAAIQIFARYLIHPTAAAATIELAPPPNMQIDILKERLSSVQATMAGQPEPPAPEIINLVGRLDELIKRANQEEI